MAGNSNRASGSRPSLRVVVPHNFRSEHSNKMLEMTSNNNARARRTETTPISHSLPLVSWYHARFSGCYAPQEFPLALSNLIVDAESGLWAPLLIPIDGFTCHQSAGSPSESQSSTELHWWISKGDKQITKCMTNIIVSINFIAIVLILIASLFRQLFWQTHWKLRWNAHRLSLRPCCKFLKHFFFKFHLMVRLLFFFLYKMTSVRCEWMRFDCPSAVCFFNCENSFFIYTYTYKYKFILPMAWNRKSAHLRSNLFLKKFVFQFRQLISDAWSSAGINELRSSRSTSVTQRWRVPPSQWNRERNRQRCQTAKSHLVYDYLRRTIKLQHTRWNNYLLFVHLYTTWAVSGVSGGRGEEEGGGGEGEGAFPS